MVSVHIISYLHVVVVPDQSSERFICDSCKHGHGQSDLVKGEQTYILAAGGIVGLVEFNSNTQQM